VTLTRRFKVSLQPPSLARSAPYLLPPYLITCSLTVPTDKAIQVMKPPSCVQENGADVDVTGDEHDLNETEVRGHCGHFDQQPTCNQQSPSPASMYCPAPQSTAPVVEQLSQTSTSARKDLLPTQLERNQHLLPSSGRIKSIVRNQKCCARGFATGIRSTLSIRRLCHR
jgi:hypothetical protein